MVNKELHANRVKEISIVLPTFNRLERLKKCLPTFLSTSTQSAEFIIVDNFSNDGTWEYLKNIAKKDDRIRIVRNPQNIGAQKSQLRGYCEVSTPYVIFLADDDMMVGDYISSCLYIFKNYPRVGIVHHFYEGWKSEKHLYKNEFDIIKSGNDSFKEIFMKSGSYPGLAWRMSQFNISKFLISENLLYPQVKISCDIALKSDLGLIRNCGLVSYDFGDDAISIKKNQNRPDDYGISERLVYLSELKCNKTKHEVAIQLASWAFDLYCALVKISHKDAKTFFWALSSNINRFSPWFCILLVKKNFYLVLIFLIFKLTDTKMIKNYSLFILIYLKRKLKI
jgi:glycosyltransferase involved in cell wall biosynthesis